MPFLTNGIEICRGRQGGRILYPLDLKVGSGGYRPDQSSLRALILGVGALHAAFGKRANLPVACLALLAALVPDRHRVTLIDENVEDIDFERLGHADHGAKVRSQASGRSPSAARLGTDTIECKAGSCVGAQELGRHFSLSQFVKHLARAVQRDDVIDVHLL